MVILTMLQELLTRKIPYFELKTDLQAMFAINQGELPSSPDTTTFVRQKLWLLCNHCWQEDPQFRPAMSLVSDQLGALKPKHAAQSGNAATGNGTKWGSDIAPSNDTVRAMNSMKGCFVAFNRKAGCRLDITLENTFDL